MTIELNDEDAEELLSALNNAIVALNEVKKKFDFGITDWVTPPWDKFLENKNCDEVIEILTKRLSLLHNLYYRISDKT